MGAVMKRDSIPLRAFQAALERDTIALSIAVENEIIEVMHRPRLERYIDGSLRVEVMDMLLSRAARFEPSEPVADCRDAKDNIYLELALAAAAAVIVSSDDDLCVLDPWRGIRILRPAGYLAFTQPG